MIAALASRFMAFIGLRPKLYGLDVLGAAKYPGLVLNHWPKGFAFGVFAEAFGDAFSLTDKMAASGNTPHIRVQLVWRDDHDFQGADRDHAVQLAEKYEKLAKKYPDVKFELSPFCEHLLAAPDVWLGAVSTAAPSCAIVNTPGRSGAAEGALSKQFKNEIHYARAVKGRFNWSYDGESCVDCNVVKDRRAYAGADVFFFWHAAFNGKLNDADKTPRPERESWPTLELILSIVHLTTKRGKLSLPAGWIWKSHADRHLTPPEFRAYKPVLISPLKVSSFRLMQSGKVVGELPYYGPFDGGGHRYYLPEFGYRIKGRCDLRANGQKFGTVNCGFRWGGFR